MSPKNRRRRRELTGYQLGRPHVAATLSVLRVPPLFPDSPWQDCFRHTQIIPKSVGCDSAHVRNRKTGWEPGPPSPAGSCPLHHIFDLAALDVINEAGDQFEGAEIWHLREKGDVFTEGGSVVVDGEESEIGTGERT
jgi:hypothetical protein